MDDVSQMNKGVQILLERMESNPDEFIPDMLGQYPSKWRDILTSLEYRITKKDYKDALPFLSDKEVKTLWQKMQNLQGELFTKKVMDTLLRGDEKGYMRDLPLMIQELEQLSPSELSSLSRQVTSGRLKKIK